MENEPITSQGLEKVKKELNELKNIKRPKIVEAIAEARAHGDLKGKCGVPCSERRTGQN